MEASASGLPEEWEAQWRREKERREQVLGEGQAGVEQDKRELRRIVAFNDSRLGLTGEKMEPGCPDGVRLYQSQSFPCETFEVLKEFLESRLLTDLTLITNDGNTFNVHSSILAAVSSFVKASVKKEAQMRDEGETAPHQWSLFLGPDVDHCGLRAILEFAYTGELITGENLPQIKAAARALGVSRLVDICEQAAGPETGQKKKPAFEEMRHTLRSIEQLWADGVGCNVILDLSGALFPVHRVILAASSDYFRGMFTSGMRESVQARIALPVNEAPEMAALICCCYRGTLSVNWDCVFELACTALRFQFRSAVSLCLLFMRQEMEASTCLDVASFAEAYGISDLLEEADDYVLRNFLEVSATEKFKDLQAEKLFKFLCSDGLSAPSELVVFRALVSWLEAEPDERLGLAGKLMRGVRFPLMTFREFREVRAINLRMETKDVQLQGAAFKEFGSSIPMQDHHRVRFPKDCLLLVGGDRLDPDVGRRIPSREIWFLNSLRSGIGLVKDIEWRMLAQIPEKPKFRHAVATIGGRLFVIGGCHFYARDNVMKSTYSYDPEQGFWRRCSDMKECRSSFSAVVHKGKLCVIGGDEQLNTNLKSVEMYDSEADTWSFVHPLDQPLSGQAATVLDERVFISGGFDSQYICLTSLFMYDPEVGSISMADMNQDRAQHCMEALRGRLYVAGGVCNLRKFYTDQLNCEVYNPAADSWTSIAPLPVPHVGAASAILEENVYILGGYCQEDYSESWLVHRFNRGTKRWERMGKVPAAVTDIRACVLKLPRTLRC
nr:kelch-like protein 33 [Nerophis lumbriciformis]